MFELFHSLHDPTNIVSIAFLVLIFDKLFKLLVLFNQFITKAVVEEPHKVKWPYFDVIIIALFESLGLLKEWYQSIWVFDLKIL